MKSVLPRPQIIICAILLVLLLGSSLASAQTTRYVGPGEAYTTISSAIQASVDGDTVSIDPGTYYGWIKIIKNITVQSTDPNNQAIIDSSGIQQRGVIIRGGVTSSAVLKDITLRHKNGTVGSSYADLFIDQNSSPTITGCHFLDSRISAAMTSGSSATFTNCTFSNSGSISVLGNSTVESCTFDGGTSGVYAHGSTTISHCLFQNVTGVGASLSDTSTMSDCTVDGGGHGGKGVTFGSNTTPTAQRINIKGCNYGIEDVSDFGSRAVVQNCLVTDCDRGYSGGAHTLLLNCTLDANTIGMYMTNGYQTVRNCIVTNSTTYGVQVGYHISIPTFSYSDFWSTTGLRFNGINDPVGTNGNISVDPLFTPKHHRLFSQAGYWNDGTAAWILGDVTSPCIDAGDPASAYDQEPDPNGGRINMGWDGDTPQASKSPTRPMLAFTGEAGYTADGVEPNSGTPGSTFTFKVKYSQPADQPAASVTLRLFNTLDGKEISGSPFTMVSDGTTDWTTGVIFSVDVELDAAGAYLYCFLASDGAASARLPVSGKLAGPYVGMPPVLDYAGLTGYTIDGVQPDRQIHGSTFTFKVKYSQADGLPATRVKVYVFNASNGQAVTGSPFTMTSDGTTDWVSGVVFSAGVKLSTVGIYQYYFTGSDGVLAGRFPVTGRILGRK